MTTNEITAAIRRKILEETTDLVTDATVLLNANLAYDDLKIKSFSSDQIKTATVTFEEGVGQLPTDFGTLYGEAYDSSSNVFTEKSISDFYRETGENAVTVEGGELKVYPSATTSLTIKYYPSYAALTAVQNPLLNSYLHELIIYGAMFRIHEDLQDEVLSKYYRDLYDKELANKVNALSVYEETNQRGNEMFTYTKLI